GRGRSWVSPGGPPLHQRRHDPRGPRRRPASTLLLLRPLGYLLALAARLRESDSDRLLAAFDLAAAATLSAPRLAARVAPHLALGLFSRVARIAGLGLLCHGVPPLGRNASASRPAGTPVGGGTPSPSTSSVRRQVVAQ